MSAEDDAPSLPVGNEADSPSREDMLEELTNEYAGYLTVDASKEMQQFDDSVEDMLTRLDEYCGLVDMIRSDTSLCLKTTIPQIEKKSEELEQMFNRIDKLEEFVKVVKQNLSVLERQVCQGEDELGSLSSIKKVFNSITVPSFLASKKSPPKTKEPRIKYTPAEIFKSDDCFSQKQDTVPEPNKDGQINKDGHTSSQSSSKSGETNQAE